MTDRERIHGRGYELYVNIILFEFSRRDMKHRRRQIGCGNGIAKPVELESEIASATGNLEKRGGIGFEKSEQR